MSYAQFHDGFYRNPKVRRAGDRAAWVWAASIGYANEHLTDGFIPAVALIDLSTEDSKPRAKLAARLVEVGLWEEAEGGWRIHDFLKWNFSREQVLARREQVLARVNKHRTNAVSYGDGNARVTRYNERDSQRTNAVSNHPPKTSVPNTNREETPLTPRAGGKAGSTPLDGGATKPRRARAPKPVADDGEPEPLPFTIAAAMEAIAEASDGRFIVPRGAEFGGARHVTALTNLIRGVPDLDRWRLVGRWLASGAMDWKTDRGLRWFLTSDAFALSRQWEENGSAPAGAPANEVQRPGEAAFLEARRLHAIKAAQLALQPTGTR